MKTKILFFLLTGLLATTACSKYPPESGRLLEDLAIYTKYDITIKFSDYKTFAVAPSVAYINGKDSASITTPEAMALLSQISQDMHNRGFTAPVAGAKPDLAINVSAIKNTNTTVYSPGWYWGYPGYYSPGWWGYPGYGYGYPYYPAYVTSYSTGTVLIDMIDLKNPTSDHKVMVRWNALIRGLLTSSHSLDDVLKSVDQAFKQTPAIKTTSK
jgi:Domain of unknown function (DUF4136)